MKRTSTLGVIFAASLGMSAGPAFAKSTDQKAAAKAQPKTSEQPATTGTSGTEPVVIHEGSETVRYDVYEVIEKNGATVSFSEGQSELSENEKGKLEDFIKRMQADAPVKKFVVAAWADAEYPADGKSLSNDAKKLAEARAKKVSDALKQAGADHIDTYEMTKRPNWFQKAFSTESAEVKGAAKTDMWSNEVMEKVGQKLRTIGGPGKVAVVAQFEGMVVAH